MKDKVTKNKIIEFVKSTQVFNKDMQNNVISVKALDNIRDFIFNVNQVFTLDGAIFSSLTWIWLT